MESSLHYKTNALYSIDFKLDKLAGKMHVHPLRFENFNGRFHYEDEHVMVEDFKGKMGRTQFQIDMNYYLGEDEMIKKRDNSFTLNSDFIDFDALSNFESEASKNVNKEMNSEKTVSDVPAHSEAFNLYELPFTDMQFNVNVGHFIYHRLDLKNITGQLRTTQNHYLYLDTISLDAAGGHIAMNGYFNGSDPEHIYLKPNLEITGVDLDKLLFKFENFGQDQIYAEILDGVIAPLEQKPSLSIEEQNELDQARLKIRLLEMTLDLYRSGSNYDESQQEAIEELKAEIAIAESSIVGELESENQELQNEINDKYAYLSSVVPCDKVSSYEKAKEIGQNLSFEGCLSLSNFVEETKILNELNDWAMNIENSIIIRSDEISEEEKVGYVESEINGDFIDSIEWGDGSINTIQKLREKIKKNIRFDRLNPSEQTLEKIQLYLSQVRSKANSQRAALLPLCELYEVTNNINLEDKKVLSLRKLLET